MFPSSTFDPTNSGRTGWHPVRAGATNVHNNPILGQLIQLDPDGSYKSDVLLTTSFRWCLMMTKGASTVQQHAVCRPVSVCEPTYQETSSPQEDSTSATGWLKKSNFKGSNHPLQLEVTWHLTFLLLEARMVLYLQWFTGKDNGTRDMLSQDTHLTETALTKLLLHSFILKQVPPNFCICLLPPAIYS
jgi:hypothetical protein